jgi:uncharacterized protein involved in exopolysaccharide biosynthesis
MSELAQQDRAPEVEPNEGASFLDLLIFLRLNALKLVLVPLLVGVVTAGITFLIAPTYTARTSFLPPAQQQNGAAAALASMGGLSGLAGVAAGASLRSPADQYIALMQSVTVSDRIIDQFKLREVYGVELRMRARKVLASKVQMAVGKRDNLITVEVDDQSPTRAAEMANRYVDELRWLTGQLALTEAQQRRLFFEQQLNLTKQKLTQAQQALLASGYNESTLKAEPKAAADGYARLRAELTAAEVRLQGLRSQFRDQAPEVEQQASIVAALRRSISTQERSGADAGGPDYVSKYREFKYQETLFDMFSRQYELARVDESREGAPIQVVDVALVPEFKSKPGRTFITLASVLVGFVLTLAWLFVRKSWKSYTANPENAAKLKQLRAGTQRF